MSHPDDARSQRPEEISFSAVLYSGQLLRAGRESGPWRRHRETAGLTANIGLWRVSECSPGVPAVLKCCAFHL